MHRHQDSTKQARLKKAEMITEHVGCTSQVTEELSHDPFAVDCSSGINKSNSRAHEDNDSCYEEGTDIEEECAIAIADKEKEDHQQRQQKARRLLGFWEVTFVLTAVFSTGNIIMIPW